jgi:hypothetical protein
MRMPGYMLIALTAAIMGFVQHLFAAEASGPTFAVTIATSGSTFKVGDPIIVTIVTTNIWNRDITLGIPKDESAAEFDNVINVWNSSGAKAAKTKYGLFMAGEDPDDPIAGPAWSNVTIILHPGEHETETAQANKMYQMTTPGTYTIQVERGWPQRPQLFARSNAISVTVVK